MKPLLSVVVAAAALGCGPPVDTVAADLDAPATAAEPIAGVVPFTVRFVPPASPDGTARLTHTWDFGDGSPPAAEVSPVHTYRQEGLYAAMLTVAGDQGPVRAQVVIVSVQPPVAPARGE